VCIAGGRPSGAALALPLADFARTVALVEKACFPLDTLGRRAEIESAGFIGVNSTTVQCASETQRLSAHGGGLQLDRVRFDDLLLKAACAMPGIHRWQPARIVGRAFVDGHWRVHLDNGQMIRVRYLADAAGRARVLRGAKRPIGARTLAIHASWNDIPNNTDGDTLVGAGQSAWYWGAPLPGGAFNATVFVGPRLTPSAGACLRLLSQSRLLWPILANAAVPRDILVCGAMPFADDSPITPVSQNTGNAALSIDPLPCQGVQRALGIYLYAAVELNTMLENPGDAERAIGFYRSRLADSPSFHAFHATAAREYCSAQYRKCDFGFWKTRAQNSGAEPLPQPLAERRRPDSIVCLSPRLESTQVAAVRNSGVVAEDGIPVGAKTFVCRRCSASRQPRFGRLPSRAAMEVTRRWSQKMPIEAAFRLLRWTCAERLIEAHQE